MGLISAALNAAGGTLASQWKEYFYVDSLPDNVLATKAQKKVRGRFGGVPERPSRRNDARIFRRRQRRIHAGSRGSKGLPRTRNRTLSLQ